MGGALTGTWRTLRLGASAGGEPVEIGPLIGRGSYGRVFKGRWHGALVAVKIVDPGVAPVAPEDAETAAAAYEVRTARESLLSVSLSHPNIVSCHRIVFVSAENRASGESARSGGGAGAASPAGGVGAASARGAAGHASTSTGAAHAAGVPRAGSLATAPQRVGAAAGGAAAAVAAAAAAALAEGKPAALPGSPLSTRPESLPPGRLVSPFEMDTVVESPATTAGVSPIAPRLSPPRLPRVASAAASDVDSVARPHETWLIMEYADRGSLEAAIQAGRFGGGARSDGSTFDLLTALRCLAEVAAGLQYLHSVGVL